MQTNVQIDSKNLRPSPDHIKHRGHITIEELVAVSPGRRNWRGIFIALLVIAAVLGLIVFSIFLLSPEDEGNRIRGHRFTLSDVNSNRLKWRPFNGTWINDAEIVYRDPNGGLSILNLEYFSVRTLMTNSTFRQLNADRFIVSPDIKFVLLLSETHPDGARYHVFEVQTRNKFPLSHKDAAREAPLLQYVLWAPNNNLKPSISSSILQLQRPIQGGGGSGSNSANGDTSNNGGKTTSQAIAFVHENDLYYKPKVQSDLVCRLTTTGKRDVIYNGIPNWLYSNTPELKSDTLSFSPDGLYLSFLTFNDSQVKEYQYTYIGENSKYPEVKSIRFPKASTTNPEVTVYVVNLSVLKFVFPQQIKLPPNVITNNSYVGGMMWASATDLSLTFTNREQTSALTVLCRAPHFNCREVHTENIVENTTVLPADTPIYSRIQTHFKSVQQHSNNATNSISSNSINKEINITTMSINANSISASATPSATETTTITTTATSTAPESNNNKFEFETGGYLLKRLPVRDGQHGYYRHVVFISTSDARTVPLTMGRFEVTEILGWDETNELVYFMAAPEKKPGQRHLYKISLKLNFTEKSNRVYVTASSPTCLTCSNSELTFRLVSNVSENTNITSDAESTSHFHIPNNCLYNKIYFSPGFSYYVQECLGPETPSIYVIDTETNMKVFVLHSGDTLRNRLAEFALPQIRTIDVELKDGFLAQVKLFLPPGMRDGEEVAFPLILHLDAAPGSQLVSEKYEVDWNWYLCSKRQMIIAQIDARGSGFQGEMLRSKIIGRLGSVEIEDQLAVLMYIRDTFDFIDRRKICSYGWGYGGYASSMAIIDDSQRVLQCAVAINPLVSFGYHTSFFTERFIPHNDDYIRALQESDLAMRAGNIDSRNFLLIHGTADTIVHQQHSLILARALIDQGISFRHQVYTDEDHNLNGVLSHLYKTMEDYFDEMFGPPEKEEWDPTGFFAFKQ